MPIKGISEVRRLRRLGRVRLGEKKIAQSGKEYPVALDHFNFEDAPELEKLFGKKCVEMDIMLPNENVEAFFPQARKAYRRSGLFCAGDGELACRVNVGLSDGKQNTSKVPAGQPLDPVGWGYIKEQKLDVQLGEMFELPCPGQDCPFTANKFCKPIGRFLFLVPKAPRVGCYEISTTSYNSIVELNSSIETVRGIAGRISMIPLKLRLVPKETRVPGSTMKKVIYHLVMEYAGTFDELAQYRGVKQIPEHQLPSRLELEHHVPEDLAPRGGEALEENVGKAAPKKEPTPKTEPAKATVPDEDAPPAGEEPPEDDGVRDAELVDPPAKPPKAERREQPWPKSDAPPAPSLPLNPPTQAPKAPEVRKPRTSLFR